MQNSTGLAHPGIDQSFSPEEIAFFYASTVRVDEDVENFEDALEFGSPLVRDVVSRSNLSSETAEQVIASLLGKQIIRPDYLIEQGKIHYTPMGLEYALWATGYQDSGSLIYMLSSLSES